MWGYYIGGMLAAKEYNNDAWLTVNNGVAYWFRPLVLSDLVAVGLTPKQIFNCLTSDINSHSALKTKLIANYGNQVQINAVFANWGF
jgi:hypothetical protein